MIKAWSLGLSPHQPFVTCLATCNACFSCTLTYGSHQLSHLQLICGWSAIWKTLRQDIAGHSLQSGGVRGLAIVATPNDHIQACSCWTSQSYQIYIWKHPVMLQSLLHSHSAIDLSTLSWSIPSAKSHWLHLLSLTQAHSFPPILFPMLQATPIHPNYTQLYLRVHFLSVHGQKNLHQNIPPQPQAHSSLLRSCGHHVTIMQPCATHTTSSAGHLASGPGTWGSQPSLFSIYFHLIAC